MLITDVRIKLSEKEDNKVKATASITLDKEFVIHDIRVIDGIKGLFIAMPSKKDINGEFKDVAHPINSAVRKYIQDRVLGEYKKAIEAIE